MMKFNFKHFLFTITTFVLPLGLFADNVESSNQTNSTTKTNGSGDNTTTSSTNTEQHNFYSYNHDDWKKNLTLSLAADGILSNAQVHSGDNTISYSSEPRFGFGLMTAAELGYADFGGVQLGVHYLFRRFHLAGGGIGVDRTVNSVMLPLEARFYLAKIISLGVGGFGNFTVGKSHDSYTSGNSTIITTNTSRKGTDWGLTGDIGVNIPLGDTLGIFGEARYNYGLTNSANSDLEEKIRDFLITVGVKVKI